MPTRWRFSTPTASAAIAAPTANQPVRGMSANRDELAQLFEGLFAEDAARPQLFDGGERRLLAGRDDLQRRRGTDPRQRLELGLGRAVDVDGSGPATARSPGPADAPAGATAGASSRDGTRT